MRGFTLLELMTTITIISILVATGVPAFANYQRHNSIRIAAQDIKSFLVEARALSLNPRPEDKGEKYYFCQIDSSRNELSLGVGGNGLDDIIKGPINLGQDVVVKTGSTTYNFYIPTGETRPELAKITIILQLKDGNESEDVFCQKILADGITGDVQIIEGQCDE